MSTSPFDSYRPPDGEGRRRRRGGAGSGGRRERAGDWLTGRARGRGEQPVVPEPEFASYYGQPVVKPVPWGHEIPAYLFLGGLAAGSGMLAAGAHATGLAVLRRNARLTSMTAVALSGAALVADLGRPERFLNMMRTVKLTSPMSVGTWIFSGFSGFASVATAAEMDRMLGGRDGGRGLPVVGSLLRWVEPVGSLGAFFLGPPLAAYTAVLLSDTATPVWFESRRGLPFVFVFSAAMASGGMQLVLTPAAETVPAQRLAVLGAVGDYVAMERVERHLHGLGIDDVLHEGAAGQKLRAAKALTVGGGVLSLLARRSRLAAVAGGLALAAGSALTRFAVVEAGQESARDPRHTVATQQARLEERRARGVVDDSITTAG